MNTKKSFQYKSKVLFWSGVTMLVSAGVIFAATGGIGRIQSLLANSQTEGCGANNDAPGCYQEEWIAQAVFGSYRVDDNDTGTIRDNGIVSIEGVRNCGDGAQVVSSYDGITAIEGNFCTFIAYATRSNGTTWPAFLDSGNENNYYAKWGIVTKWSVKGHVH